VAFQAAKRDEREASFDPGRRGFDPRLPLFLFSYLGPFLRHFQPRKRSNGQSDLPKCIINKDAGLSFRAGIHREVHTV
jgi:hypothetical protein